MNGTQDQEKYPRYKRLKCKDEKRYTTIYQGRGHKIAWKVAAARTKGIAK
jgi:hypothetical protein